MVGSDYSETAASSIQFSGRYTKVSAQPAERKLSLKLRVLDIIIASCALFVFLPLMLTVSVLIFLQDGGPPIYSQRRVGYRGRLFPCLKFRSMVQDSDRILRELLESNAEARAEWDRDQKLRKDPRITLLGQLLRKSSIDELPQLINVLRGEMSIVGPRPIVQNEVVRYGWRIKSYLSVRPGLTGLWQVSGRNGTSYRRRVAIDHVFAKSLNVGLYLYIVIMTVPTVLSRRGSY